MAGIRESLKKNTVWTFTTYFAEGFPFSLIRTVSSVFFRDMKVSLEAIGFTSLFNIPWSFKFLWSPLIDRYGTKRKWLLGVQAALCLLFFLLPLLLSVNAPMMTFGLILFIGSFIAATHDIAIDAYYLEALDKADQSKFVGYRVMAYRIAMMTGSGIIVAIGAKWSWTLAYFTAAVLFTLLLIYHWLFLPEPENHLQKPAPTESPLKTYLAAFVTFFNRSNIGVILAFIILLRAGEFMIGSMLSPFFVDIGLKLHYSWISSLVGLPASIIGAMLGGWAISRYTMEKMIWPFILAQNLTILIYMALALYLGGWVLFPETIRTAASSYDIAAVAVVHFFEQFGGGLGNAVLMVYLMRLCSTEHKAAHYAIGSGLMSVIYNVVGPASGIIAGQGGYALLFGVSFLVSVPGMLLIPFLNRSQNKR